jgi:hypothetical protein
VLATPLPDVVNVEMRAVLLAVVGAVLIGRSSCFFLRCNLLLLPRGCLAWHALMRYADSGVGARVAHS